MRDWEVRPSDELRDGLLSVAGLVAGLAYLVMTVGSVVSTSSGAGFVIAGKEVAAGWLHAEDQPTAHSGRSTGTFVPLFPTARVHPCTRRRCDPPNPRNQRPHK